MITLTDLHVLVDDLTVLLAEWAKRDDSKPQPDVRRAGADAVSTLDALTGELYRLRGILVGEILASDKASAARVDALLAEHRDGAR